MIVSRDELAAGFRSAWRDLVFFPFPAFRPERQTNRKNGFSRLFFYPLLGMLFGVVLLMIGWISSLFLSRLAAAAIFGGVSLLLLEGKDRASGISRQARLLTVLFTGDDFDGEASRQMFSSAFLTLLMLAKLTSCISLFYHGSGGLVGAALIVNFSLRSELLGFGDVNPHCIPAVECSMLQRRFLRGEALLLLFLMALPHLSLFLMLGMGTALLLLAAERIAIRSGSLESGTVSLWGSCAETAALLLSALLTL